MLYENKSSRMHQRPFEPTQGNEPLNLCGIANAKTEDAHGISRLSPGNYFDKKRKSTSEKPLQRHI
jgi:hypothetical protein